MAITPGQYPLLISCPTLQEPILDKDTGFPLAGGIVTFYKDNARNILKTVYYQTGTPGAYTYIPTSNPMTLTSIGTPADPNGNDILLFFFPFEEDDPTQEELYYITVESSESVAQFARAGFPSNVSSEDEPTVLQDQTNLIPNGQFAAHTDLPNNGLYPAATSSVVVAPGGPQGWIFEKPNTSTDVDYVTFNYLNVTQPGLTAYPRYAIDLRCASTTAGDAYKRLSIRFQNVNTFASDSQEYTFSFAGRNNNSGTVNVELQLIKNFGTGGSTTTTENIQGFTLVAGEFQQQSISFVFGTNDAATIGVLNDDYVQLDIALPVGPGATYDMSLTNFILVSGTVDFSSYPVRPTTIDFASGIAGSLPIPDPAGGDLYLPIVYGKTGFIFDRSPIGKVVASLSATPSAGELACDGTTYLASGYSNDGIPYSRLRDFLYASGAYNGLPLYGTGSDFVTGYISSAAATTVVFTENTFSAATPPIDSGPSPTGFTFANQRTSAGAAYNILPMRLAAASLQVKCTTANGGSPPTSPTTGTMPGGFTMTSTLNIGGVPQIFTASVMPTAATLTSGGVGYYWTFSTPTTSFYVWYKVGVETDPAPGGTGIRVDLLATDTAADVTYKTYSALLGGYQSTIVTTAASAITAGSYFTFTANAVSYYVWMKKNGSSDPGISGTGIPVIVTTGDTAATVATALQTAINKARFAVPDLQGMFLRGRDNTQQWDYASVSRASIYNGAYYGVGPGTFEFDLFQSHNHGLIEAGGGGGTAVVANLGTPVTNNTNILFKGGVETRPVNTSVTWMIKY